MQMSHLISRAIHAHLRETAGLELFRTAKPSLADARGSADSSLSQGTLYETVIQAYKLSANPARALSLGTELAPHTMLVVGHLFATAPTLRVVMADLQRYSGLIFPNGTFSLGTREAPLACLRYATTFAEVWIAQFAVEFAFAWSVNIGRRFVGQSTSPREVRLPFSAPAHAEAYERTFRCPITFDCKFAELVFDSAYLDIRQPFADEPLYRLLKQRAEREMAAHEASSWHQRVREALANDEHMRAEVGTRRLSQALGVAPRYLRRGLAKEGYNLNELRDEARREAAFTLLRETDVPIKQIAERLGFTETSPFYRAFRRWSPDRTPADFRRRRRPSLASQLT